MGLYAKRDTEEAGMIPFGTHGFIFFFFSLVFFSLTKEESKERERA